jgi:hypothetical protein
LTYQVWMENQCRHKARPQGRAPPAIVALLTLGALALSACGGDESRERFAGDREGPPRNAAVRGCGGATADDGAYLDLESRQNIRAGPLILYLAGQYANAPRSEFAPVRFIENAPPLVRREIRNRTAYAAVKQLLVFRGTRAVTLEIQGVGRGHAALLYATTPGYTEQEARLGLAQISDGVPAVRFEPCERGTGPFTQFPGGLVVAGARCLPLHIWVEGREQPLRRVVSFGMGGVCEERRRFR